MMNRVKQVLLREANKLKAQASRKRREADQLESEARKLTEKANEEDE